jgi:hypothetical protein
MFGLQVDFYVWSMCVNTDKNAMLGQLYQMYILLKTVVECVTKKNYKHECKYCGMNSIKL